MPEMIRQNAARIRENRERVIVALQEHFAHDDLDVDEFERRVTLAHTTESLIELDALTRDLLPLKGEPTATPASAALVPAAHVPPIQTLRGFMSATTRTGPWTVPRRLRIRAVMSSTVLDFREARFPAGPVDIEIRAVMSSVEIVVPPGLAVETSGLAIMGAFDDVDRSPSLPDPEAPLLRIQGLALMGAVEVKMRLPGETDRQHRRRQRLESREARQPQAALDSKPK